MTVSKIKILFFSIFLLPAFVFAKTDKLDDAITKAGEWIISAAEKKEITRIAILDFSADSEKLGQYIKDQLSSELSEYEEIELVEREDTDIILEELDFQSSGYVDDKTILSYCKRLGAQALIRGKIEEIAKEYQFHIKMIDVETGRTRTKNYSVSSSNKITYFLEKEENNKSQKTAQNKTETKNTENSSRTYTSNKERNSWFDKIRNSIASSSEYDTENKKIIGVTIEGNMYAREGIAPAFGGIFAFDIFEKSTLGCQISAAIDRPDIMTMEILALWRYYIFSQAHSGFFCELQTGGAIIGIEDEKSETEFTGAFVISGEVGYQIGNEFYFEPYVRFGYPFIFGFGISAGLKL